MEHILYLLSLAPNLVNVSNEQVAVYLDVLQNYLTSWTSKLYYYNERIKNLTAELYNNERSYRLNYSDVQYYSNKCRKEIQEYKSLVEEAIKIISAIRYILSTVAYPKVNKEDVEKYMTSISMRWWLKRYGERHSGVSSFKQRGIKKKVLSEETIQKREWKKHKKLKDNQRRESCWGWAKHDKWLMPKSQRSYSVHSSIHIQEGLAEYYAEKEQVVSKVNTIQQSEVIYIDTYKKAA